jgi:hypothetical protein
VRDIARKGVVRRRSGRQAGERNHI